jgi:sugar phosphate permease
VYYGWRIAAASFMILLVIVGIVYYSFPVFYPALIEEFGWSRAQVTAGFFYSILIVGPIFGISAGFLIDRHGTKRILIAGLIAAGAAFLGFFSMHSLPAYYLFYSMQSIGYVSAGPIPNQVLISQWFSRMRGRAMGMAYVGIGIGGAMAPVLAQYLVGQFGWRPAMLLIGGIIFLVLLPLVIMMVKDRPSDLQLCPDGERLPAAAEAQSHSAAMPLRAALRTRSFWMILLGSSLSIGAVGGIIQHLQLFLRDEAFAPEAAARVASFLLVSSIAGRLVMGDLADRFNKKYVMLAAFLMVGSAIPLLYLAHRSGAVYGFAFLFGFGMGADYMLIPLVTAQSFGVASLGRLMGVILTADAISQAFAPVVVGRLFDLQRNYDWGFALLTVAALAAAVAATQIRTREIRSEHTTD